MLRLPRLRLLIAVIAVIAVTSWAGLAHAETPEIPDEPPAPPRDAPASKKSEPEPPAQAPRQERAQEPTSDSTTTQLLTPTFDDDTGKGTTDDDESGRARLAPSSTGETGLLRVASADSLAPRIIRLSFGLDLFSVGAFIREGDNHRHIAGIIGISASPIDHVEFWLNTRFASNRNATTDPELLQSLGDYTLGVKGFYAAGDLSHVGMDLQLSLLAGIGETSFGATQIQVRGLYTADFSRAEQEIPLRAHLNLGLIFDNSDRLATTPLTNAERFALGVSDFHRVLVGVGLEVPVKYVTPYLEYTAEFPIDYLATPGIVVRSRALRPAQTAPEIADEIARPAIQRAIPHRITPGVRITAVPDLTIDLAVEIGLTPEVANGVIATPPYNVVMLASYPFDPFRPDAAPNLPIVAPIASPVVPPTPTTGAITGTVRNQSDGKPIEGAIATFDRAPPVATGPDGQFLSHTIEQGPLRVTITKDGFESASGSVDLEIGDNPPLVFDLAPQAREGVIRGHILDEKEQPIAGLQVEIEGPLKHKLSTTPDGLFEVKAPPGKYTLVVAGEGYLKKSREFELEAAGTYSTDIVVRPRPKEALAEVSNGMIVVSRSVHFVTGEARLAPDASAVLDSVLDVLVANPEIKQVRVEGHTDNIGAETANVQLSKDRASSVVAYLVEQGIDPHRLTFEGHGSARPVAPNLTRRGREQNRRVEFHILER